MMSKQAPQHVYENSAEFINRLGLTENTDTSQNTCPFSMSSKSSNYVAMNPSQFSNNSFKEVAEADEELVSQKVLPLIPFDPTHNLSTCGSSRACHEYEDIDPIR